MSFMPIYKSKKHFLNTDYPSNYVDSKNYDMSDYYIETYVGDFSGAMTISGREIVQRVRQIVMDFVASEDVFVNMVTASLAVVSYYKERTTEDHPPYINVVVSTTEEDIFGRTKKTSGSFTSLNLTYKIGSYSNGLKLRAAMEGVLFPLSAPSLEWHFKNNGSIDYKRLHLPEPANGIRDSHYPYLTGGYKKYQKDYLESTSPILLLSGPPGTGKTSFLRNMIYHHKKSCVMTFDAEVMQSDQFFINFITSTADIMVIEDADTLLTSREDEGNKTMSKILNASDGLIKLDNKKIVFTTNVLDISRIDTALVRPGRCFDTVNFRKLTCEEARIVAKESGIEKDFTPGNEYTLAEVYEEWTTKGSVHNSTEKKIGFY